MKKSTGNKRLLFTLFIAWLIPGAGHYYLGHKWKGILLLAILSLTYITGMAMADFRNVALVNPLHLFSCSFTGGFTILAVCTTAGLPNTPQWYPHAYELGCLYLRVTSLLNALVLLYLYEILRSSSQ